jgi:CHAT domain-containing protein
MATISRPACRAATIAALCAAAFGLPQVGLGAPPGGRSEPACKSSMSMTLAPKASARCVMSWSAGSEYLLRAPQRTLDVSISVQRPDGRLLAQTNSPVRLAGTELLLLKAPVSGRYRVIVAPDVMNEASGSTTLSIMPVGGVSAGQRAAWRALSATAAEHASSSQADPAWRVRTLEALLQSGATLDAATTAEVWLRLAWIRYMGLEQWPASLAAAESAKQGFLAAGDTFNAMAANVIGAAAAIEFAREQAVQSRAARSAAESGGDTREPGGFRQAEDDLLRAARYFQSAGLRLHEADARNYLGVSGFYSGRYPMAREQFRVAADLFIAGESPARAVSPLQNIAVLDFDQGDYVEAIASYEELLARVPDPDVDDLRGTINSNLGLGRLVVGDYDGALRNFSAALVIARERGSPLHTGNALFGLGRSYLLVGDRDRAAEFLGQSLAVRDAAPDRDRRGLMGSLVQIGNLKRESGDPAGALRAHTRALELAVSPVERVTVLYAVGQDQLAAGTPASAEETLARALQIDMPPDRASRNQVVAAQGLAQMRRGKSSGRVSMKRAAAALERTGVPDLAAREYFQLANQLAAQGELDAALVEATKATTLFSNERIGTVNPDLRSLYLASKSSAFRLRAELMLQLASRSRDPAQAASLRRSALAEIERQRAVALEDFSRLAAYGSVTGEVVRIENQLAGKRYRLATLAELPDSSADRIAELQSDIAMLRVKLDVAQARSATPQDNRAVGEQSLERLRESLAPDEAVLTYLLADRQSWAWCVTRDDVSAVALPARAEIEARARDLQGLWQQPGDIDTAREKAASEAIIGNLDACLAGRRHLTVVPDGALRFLPFAALRMPGERASSDRRLIDELVVTQRLSIWDWTGARRERVTVAKAPSMLLVGDPAIAPLQPRDEGVSSARVTLVQFRGAEPLPGAAREIALIAQIAKGWRTEILNGESATRGAVVGKLAQPYRIVHFAAHATIDAEVPQMSAIRLADDSRLTAREIVGLRLAADAVVLSACDGSLGKPYAGGWAFGLTEAFLLAGARHVVGSVWRVPDAAAERYMERFYTGYLSGNVPPADAARAAALALRSAPATAHPFFWAGFVLTEA